MTSVWVAEHGWVYLMAAIDCCTREIVAWHLQTRCRAKEAIALIEQAAAQRGIAPGTCAPAASRATSTAMRCLTRRARSHRRGRRGGSATRRIRR